MFNRFTFPKIDILCHPETSQLDWCSDAVLIAVSGGKNALNVKGSHAPDNEYGYMIPTELQLNEVPLIQARLPLCSTSAGLLAAGYGIRNADCPELRVIDEQINMDYTDLETSVKALTPMLGLLESGLYVIADVLLYPTDGNGKFFWDITNQLTEHPSTSCFFAPMHNCVGGFPSYLYPSQSTSCFDEKRVQYYIDRFSQTKNPPRAIAYRFVEFISVLLDGHHKAAAAALLGRQVNCLCIIPTSSYKTISYYDKSINEIYFSEITISAQNVPRPHLKDFKSNFIKTRNKGIIYKPIELNTLDWAKKYKDSVRNYPPLSELASIMLYNLTEISDQLISECQTKLDDESQYKLIAIILRLMRTEDPRLKQLAFTCGKLQEFPKVAEAAFDALNHIKNDPEVENYFIDYLVYHQDKHDYLKDIADHYWDD